MTLMNYGMMQRETSGIYLIGNKNAEEEIIEMPRPYEADTQILSLGIEGEEQARDKLVTCLEDCRILTNVPVRWDDRQTEIDMLVINRKGITIVEVKNYSGIIVEKDKNLITQKMTYPNGATQSRDLKNPLLQTRREVFLLNKVLAENHINCWIHHAVYFNRALLVKFHDMSNVYTDCCDLASVIQSGKTIYSNKRVNALASEIAEICSHNLPFSPVYSAI